MKGKSLITFFLLVGFGSLIIGCKTSAGSKATSQDISPQNIASPVVPSDNSKAQRELTSQDNQNEDKTEPPSYNANPEPQPPPLSSKGTTHEVMKNVNFHADDLVAYDIRTIRGSLLGRYKNRLPIFDDKRSFILKLDYAVIGIRMDTMANLMNNYVFAYHGAPLKNFHFSVDGNQLKATGSVHKVADLPFEVKGNLSATPDSKIRVHPTSIKTGGLPVKGFMHLFGVELDEVVKARQARGLRIEDNDLILDPEHMGPPPLIRGRVTAVQIVGDEVVMIFGGGKNLSEAEIARRANSRTGGNYLYYHGGTVQFGKLTMKNADMKIVDANPKDPFDFSIDHYNQQLVAGYSKTTSRYGVVAHVPDYYKIQKTSATESSTKTNSNKANSKSPAASYSSNGGNKSMPFAESRASSTSQPKQLVVQPKKRGFLTRFLHRK